jgi:hypothetical protein
VHPEKAHAGTLAGAPIQADSAAFGIEMGDNKDGDALKTPSEQHWGIIRESIHNHIGSLNFGTVSCFAKEVTY